MSLRELRQKRGLTQRQLADKSGVPHTRIAATETGSRPIENIVLAWLSSYVTRSRSVTLANC